MAGEDSVGGAPRQRRRMLLGALILLALVGTAVLIFFMDDIRQSLVRTYAIHVVLDGAAGLTEKSPVWVGGREVGAVETVGFMPAGADTLSRVFAIVRLPVSVRAQVRADSDVRITSVSLISDPVVDIAPGTAAAPELEPGDTLRQAPHATPAQLAARASVVRAGLQDAVTDLRVQLPAIGARLRSTRQAFAGLDAVMEEAARLQEGIDASPGLAVLQDPAFAASLRRTREHAAELPRLIERARSGTGGAADVSAALARLQLRADSLAGYLAAAGAALENPNGTLARMQQDSALVRAIHGARAELDSLIADARRNPLRYVF